MGCISSKSSDADQPSNHQINPNHSVNNASDFTVPKHDDMSTVSGAGKTDHGSLQWSLDENKLTIERCSSFHTVEEYDELLRRINGGKDDGELVRVPLAGYGGGGFQAVIPLSEDETRIQQQNSIPPLTGYGESEFHTVISLSEDETGIQQKQSLIPPLAEYGGLQTVIPLSEDKTGMIKEKNTEDTESFQTVASLRQWLHSPCVADTDADEDPTANTATDHPTTKLAFGFYDDNNKNTETLGENLVMVKTIKKQEDETITGLVAVFDQYMQQLQIDQDNILKHIDNIID